jgi:hypothetical protein
MGKTASVACHTCGALNDVLMSEGTFDDNLRRASFSFACRLCGAALPDELPPHDTAEPPTPASDGSD